MTDRLEEIKNRLKQMSEALVNELALIDTRWLVAEVERLDHLHKLDHSLADNWAKKVAEFEKENERLRGGKMAIGHDDVTYDSEYVDKLRATIATLQEAWEAAKEILDVLYKSGQINYLPHSDFKRWDKAKREAKKALATKGEGE